MAARAADRGAALVEAALILPVLALLVFGLIEYGLVFKDYLTVANMTRAGARISASDGATAYADYDVLQAVKSAGNALGAGTLQYLVVFKASSSSSALPTGCDTASQLHVCNRYQPSDLNLAKTSFGTCTADTTAVLDGAWCPVLRANTLSGNSGAGPDYVGVYVKVRHAFVTGLFGSARTITDTTVMRIEPVAS